MASLNMSPPWIVFYRKVSALFSYDTDIRVVYNNDNIALNLYVDNQEKAEALTTLLPVEKDFGSVKLAINVIPANGKLKKSNLPVNELFKNLFVNNEIVSYTQDVEGIFSNSLTYIVFKKTVVQFFTDDLGDINGYYSTLYENIAEEVFENRENVFFCTDVADCVYDLRKPLGEWP